MVKPLQYRCLHDFIECCHVDDHAGFAVDGAANEHLNDIVVPVAVGVVALAVGCSICLVRKRVGMEPVAGTEHVSAAEVGGLHQRSPRYSAKISGVS